MRDATRPAIAAAPPAVFTPSGPRAARAVRLWLYVVAALIVAMVGVGGATRLTESGLSITQWKPVTGVVPPLSPAEWQAEFERYKAIPQYEILNRGMGLDGFKRIYWWEWTHRLLGRLVGAVVLLPLLYFAATGAVRGWLLACCLGLFALGGLQGAVGWWMVASGLSARTSVSPYRLAIHLTLAGLILSATVMVARTLAPPAAPSAAPPDMGMRLRATAVALPILVLVQIFAGGLVAGLDAGMAFNTWPLMDGALIPAPDQLGAMRPWWRNLFENALTVQFDHRMIAYALWAASLLHALDARRTHGARGAWLLFAVVSAQAMLGIATLLLAVPLGVALAHQFGATVVLIAATLHAADMTQATGMARRAPYLSAEGRPPPAPSSR
ncbi:COX15/CtaA family protein [Xanthobacter agilis]|uniref:COX15/CtaA family protein n=1 Tax=Xanthobacter agilis TaxID=47492 RepID=UPI00372AC9A6